MKATVKAVVIYPEFALCHILTDQGERVIRVPPDRARELRPGFVYEFSNE